MSYSFVFFFFFLPLLFKLNVCLSQPIAKNALTILINLSADEEIMANLVDDDSFVDSLLAKLTVSAPDSIPPLTLLRRKERVLILQAQNAKEPNADDVSMLIANLAKSSKINRLLTLKRKIPESVSSSAFAIDQLMDCFVKGAEGALNKHANYDYLSYLFADLSKSEDGRAYFTTRQDYDGVVPVTKLTVFTEHKSTVRRKGVASTIKNVAFDIPFHSVLLSEDDANILPYILLPIAGPEEFADDESMDMLADLQLLPPDKKRDSDSSIIVTHLETLLLLTTTREGRNIMRAIKVYPIIRECHLHVDDEDVREACDRLVQVLMREEQGEEGTDALQENGTDKDNRRQEDEEEKVVELF